MASEEEIRQRLDDAWDLTERARSAAIAEAVTWADELGDESLQVETRVDLMRSYLNYSDSLAVMAPLAWLLKKEKTSPELFSPDDIATMLWCYKYAVWAIMSVPSATAEQINQMLDDFEAYSRAHGATFRAVHARRFTYLRMCGRVSEAKAELDAWRASPRDDNSDCPTCDPRYEVENYLDEGNFEAAYQAALPTLTAEDPCNMQPQSMETLLLIEMARQRRWREAWFIYQRGARLARKNADGLPDAGVYLRYLAATGRFDEAISLVRDTVRYLENVEHGRALQNYLTGVVYLSQRLIREGRGDEKLLVRGTFKGRNPWFPFVDLEEPTVFQAVDHLMPVLDALVARFDERDSTDWHSQRLADQLSLEDLDDPLACQGNESGIILDGDLPESVPIDGEKNLVSERVHEEVTEAAVPVVASHVNDAFLTYELSIMIPDDLDEFLDLAGDPNHRWHTTLHGRLQDRFASTHWHTDLQRLARLTTDQLLVYWGLRAKVAMRLGLSADLEEALNRRLHLAKEHGRTVLALEIEADLAECELLKLTRLNEAVFTQLGFENLLQQAQAIDHDDDPFSLIGTLFTLGTAAARCRHGEPVGVVLDLLKPLLEDLISASTDPIVVANLQGYLPIYEAQLSFLGGEKAEACRMAAELIKNTSSPKIVARAQVLIGLASLTARHVDDAIPALREAVNLFLATNQRVEGLHAVWMLADALHFADREIECAAFVEQMMMRFDDLPQGSIYFNLRQTLAYSLFESGDATGALGHAEAVGDWFSLDSDFDSAGKALNAYRLAAAAADRAILPQNAVRLHTRVAGMFGADGDTVSQSRELRQAVRAWSAVPFSRRAQVKDNAVALLDEARSLIEDNAELRPSRKSWELADCDEDQALILWRLDENLEALDWVEKAAEGFTVAKDSESHGRVLYLGARAAYDANLPDLALNYIARSREAFDTPRLRNHPMLEGLAELEENIRG